MTGKPIETEGRRARPEPSEPQVLVSYQPAGRETLEAITGELVPLPASSAGTTAGARESSSPDISVREGTIERDTLAAIMAEAGAVRASATTSEGAAATVLSGAAKPAVAVLEVFEMMTYVVRGGDVARLASEDSRRSFVAEHLLTRLPVSSMADVERVDVTPWTVPGTLVVRVWCRARPRP